MSELIDFQAKQIEALQKEIERLKAELENRNESSDWLSISKNAYVIGVIGLPVKVNIDSLDYEKKIVNISKEGRKSTRKFNELYQFYSDCDFR